jgi:hypothetical protein
MGALKAIWETWKVFGGKFGDFQARVILTLFYFVILAPFALVVRFWSDPLTMKSGSSRGWQPLSDAEGPVIERARKQF